MTNKTLIFKKIPTEAPVPGEHLVVEDRPVDMEAAPPAGGITVQVLYASFDPYLRGMMRDPAVKSYAPALAVNSPVVNGLVARVLKSASPDFGAGEVVSTRGPIAEYAVIPDAARQARKVHNPHRLHLGYFLGPLGMPGLTAWSAFHKIGRPQKGETVLVSSAAGAVGQVVGQIARREGLTVIGSVGSDEKLDFVLNELGFHAAFNYKKEKPAEALARLAPDGIDIYFDNVGGEHLDAALARLNKGGRIPLCGMISDYNVPVEKRYGVKGLMNAIGKNITITGFLVGDKGFGDAYGQEHQEKMQQWLGDGSVKAKIHVTDGIDQAAKGLVGMLAGDNFGKAVLRIKD